jgi:hypothetical protein
VTGLRHAIIVFLVVRVLASISALIGAAAIPNNPVVAAGGYEKPAYSRLLELSAGVWEKSDALWYIRIARDGYEGAVGSAAFMPLYPFAVRAVHWLGGAPWIVCALIVSNVCFFLALVYFQRLVSWDFANETARRSVWYLALFPGSFYLLAPYSESMFLLLAVASLHYARSGRWWHAALAGLLLCLTRNLGVLIVIPLLFEVFRQRRGLVRVLIVPLGILGWMAHWHFTTGNAFEFIKAQEHWERTYRVPWMTLYDGIEQAWQFALTLPGGIYIFEAIVAVCVVVVAVLSVVVLPAAYSSLIWVFALPSLVAPYPGRTLMSFIRFAAVLFPGFITLGRLAAAGDWIDRAILISFASLYGLAVALFVASQNMF